MLRDSLADLHTHVAARAAGGGRGALWGFFDYYREHVEELSLGLYLYNGIGPTGLDAALDRDLNRRLRQVVDLIEQAYAQDGVPDAESHTAGGIAQAIGLLVMETTGRLRLFEGDAESLFEAYLDRA